MRAFIIIMVSLAALTKLTSALVASAKISPYILMSMENWALWFAVVGFFVYQIKKNG